MRVAFSNDHAGLDSRHLIDELKAAGHEVVDYGVKTTDSVDYPDLAGPALRDLVDGKVDRAILVCGSGIGMSMVANRVVGVRCALCTDTYGAEMSRRHNNSNCLALRSRHQSEAENSEISRIWMATEFEGGRHERRVEKIEAVGAACPADRLLHEGENNK